MVSRLQLYPQIVTAENGQVTMTMEATNCRFCQPTVDLDRPSRAALGSELVQIIHGSPRSGQEATANESRRGGGENLHRNWCDIEAMHYRANQLGNQADPGLPAGLSRVRCDLRFGGQSTMQLDQQPTPPRKFRQTADTVHAPHVKGDAMRPVMLTPLNLL